MKVLLDAGHGMSTPGKRSPDGRLYEWEFNRDIVCRIRPLLNKLKIDHVELVPETYDVSLKERCKRANQIHHENNGNTFLVSIHANAGGGTGWEIWTSPGQTESDVIAEFFFKEAELAFAPEWKMRADKSDGDSDKEAHFYILEHTICPAVLTENFFMDTKKDLDFIVSNEGRQRIAEMHVRAIVNYIESKNNA